MSKIPENIILTAAGLFGYYIINTVLSLIIDFSHIIAFIIIVFPVFIYHDKLIGLITKYTIKNYYVIISEAQKVLEQLNDNLNRAVRYHEITKHMSETFDILFKNSPYSFYILENNRYYLVHYGNIDDYSEILLMNLKSDCFSKISSETIILTDLNKLDFGEPVLTQFRNAGLNTMLPFRGHNQIFAILFVDRDKISFFKENATRRLFQKIQRKAGLILENSALFLDLEQKNYETTKIIEVSQKILSSLDTKNILDFILESLQKIVQFDAASIFLLDESGAILLNASSLGYQNYIGDKLHLKVGQGACGWVVQTKQVDILDDVRGAKHYYELRPETRSQISIPLIFDDKVLGVICVESDQIAYFTDNLADILKLFAHLASIAVHNARQFEVMLAKQALEHELINAGVVQQRLLVQQFPSVKGLTYTAENIPSKIVSGDIYDFIRFNDSTLGVAIGDVSGKGAPAALMMTLMLAGLRSHQKSVSTVRDIVFQINNLLYDSISRNKFASFFYAQILLDRNMITYTNAGHNPPVLIKSDGSVKVLRTGGIVLGFIRDYDYHQSETEFEPGDLLAAYTDGVTETLNKKGEEFGEERFIQILKKNRDKSADEIKKKIIRTLKEFSENTNPADDITLIICKHD